MAKEHSTTIIIIAVVGLLFLIFMIMKPKINISGGATNSGFNNPFNSYPNQPAIVPITSVPLVINAPAVSDDPNGNGTLKNEPTFTGNNAQQIVYQ